MSPRVVSLISLHIFRRKIRNVENSTLFFYPRFFRVTIKSPPLSAFGKFRGFKASINLDRNRFGSRKIGIAVDAEKNDVRSFNVERRLCIKVIRRIDT